ncbi:MAG: hypothetical protein KC501_41030 [Myxococcales bacterium]|nr:hypothetical protein [Myxococcales bacterium]
MATEDIAGTLSALAKEMYPDDEIGNTLMKGSAIYAEMPKSWDGGGRYERVPVKYASTSGSGNDFAEAQAAHDEAQRVAFEVPWYDDFSLYRLSDKAIQGCRGDEHAMADALQEVGDDAMDTIQRNMHWALWRNGGGARGQIASGSGTDTIKLVDIEDIVHFQVNDLLESYNTDGSAVTTGDGEYLRVYSLSEDDGTLTLAAGTWGSSGNFQANDYLFKRGTIGKAVVGISGIIPATAPTATLFWAVDRSRAPNALGGVRLDALASDGTIENYLIRAASRLKRNKGQPSHCYLNPVDFGQLVSELGDKVHYEKYMPTNSKGMQLQGHIGFDHIVVAVGSGLIKVYAEADVPYGRVYLLTMKGWRIRGMKQPGLLMADGLAMARGSNFPGYEGRMGCFWHIRTNAPGHNLTGDISAVQAPAP